MEFKVGDTVYDKSKNEFGKVVELATMGKPEETIGVRIRTEYSKLWWFVTLKDAQLVGTAPDTVREIALYQVKKGDRIRCETNADGVKSIREGIAHSEERRTGRWETKEGGTLNVTHLVNKIFLLERRNHGLFTDSKVGDILRMEWEEKNLQKLYIKKSAFWLEIEGLNSNGLIASKELAEMFDNGAKFVKIYASE